MIRGYSTDAFSAIGRMSAFAATGGEIDHLKTVFRGHARRANDTERDDDLASTL